MSFVGMLYNIQLMKYAGENGVAAYGVLMYVGMIFFSAFIGYSVGTAPAENEDNLDIPQVAGVVLKDGTRLPYLTDGGGVGYTDDSKRNAYHIAGYDRVIDVDAVAALIVWTFCENEMVEIPISQ